MTPKTRLGVERLEGRDVPALFGVPWVDPTHLTLSFAPEGAGIAGTANNLPSKLGANYEAFKSTVLRAAQTWAAQANISISVVTDDGSAFGTAGATQGDSRFGDIRIGGRAFALSASAVAVPPDPFLSGTWAGDVVFNTRVDWSRASSKLLNVALHEIGHALGLDENNDPTSVLVKNLKIAPSVLSANDVAAIRGLYGAPRADQYEGSNGNSSADRAANLSESDDEPTFAFGTLATTQDVDFFRYQTPGDSGPTTLRVLTNGLSLLRAQVTVYTEGGSVVAQGTVDSLGGALALTFNAAKSDKYFVKVASGSAGVFGAGRYSFAITPNALGVSPDALDAFLRGPYGALSPSEVEHAWEDPLNTLVNDDGPEDEGEDGATDLSSVRAGRLFTVGSLNGPTDADYYRVRTPATGTIAITAAVTRFGPNGIVPQLELYDLAGNRVAADVVANGTGGFAIQANRLVANTQYVVRAVSPTGASGNYQMVVETKAVGPLVRTNASGVLTSALPTKTYRFFVAQNGLYHFALTAGPESGIQMTVRDGTGAVAFQLTAPAGQTVSVPPALIVPGPYRVEFTAADPLGPAGVAFRLRGAVVSDPVGPTLVNPATTPQYIAPTPPSPGLTYLYPGQVFSALPFAWIPKTL